MNDLRFTLTTDGSSDSVLLHHLRWILRQVLRQGVAIQAQWADIRSLRQVPGTLSERISVVKDLYPCDLLFVHRDAEGAKPAARYSEIADAIKCANVDIPVVPVVPIRMTEAWLLFDEGAVRKAAGNPNGDMPLDLPAKNVEDIADPKALLHGVLRAASGLTGRRLRSLRTAEAVHRVAEYIDDFSLLRGLTAFDAISKDIASVAQEHGW
jgi:hypothetical protein